MFHLENEKSSLKTIKNVESERLNPQQSPAAVFNLSYDGIVVNCTMQVSKFA